MIIIGRHINGITLNPLEYVLERENGSIRLFVDHDDARIFLKANGVDDDDLQYFVFEEVEDNRKCPA